MSNLDVTDYSSDLSRMEQRIRMEEARADAQTQLSSDSMGADTGSMFDDAERNAQVDQQLADLKARMGMSGGSGGSSSGSGTQTTDLNRNR